MKAFAISLTVLLVSAFVSIAEYPLVTSIVQKFGKPDVDDSIAYDKPRPPFVTRWLIY